jgi:hypothetical protein
MRLVRRAAVVRVPSLLSRSALLAAAAFAMATAPLAAQQPRDSGKRADLLIWSVDEYITFAGPQLEAGGFHERELHRVTERYGNVVHVFSTYDSKRTLQDAKPFARGINSIQLLKDGGRYCVVSIFWDSERPGNPIPAAYLP